MDIGDVYEDNLCIVFL